MSPHKQNAGCRGSDRLIAFVAVRRPQDRRCSPRTASLARGQTGDNKPDSGATVVGNVDNCSAGTLGTDVMGTRGSADEEALLMLVQALTALVALSVCLLIIVVRKLYAVPPPTPVEIQATTPEVCSEEKHPPTVAQAADEGGCPFGYGKVAPSDSSKPKRLSTIAKQARRMERVTNLYEEYIHLHDVSVVWANPVTDNPVMEPNFAAAMHGIEIAFILMAEFIKD